MKRRTFLRNTTLATTAALVPQFLQGVGRSAAGGSRSGKILIVIQLSGGNDGLNTLVPFRQDPYYALRPGLALPKESLIGVDDAHGWHPALSGLQDLMERGELCVVNGIGYPNPDRSHFRSMDIWHTGSGSDAYWESGWLGRYLDSACAGDAPTHHAIEVDNSLSLALRGQQERAFVLGARRELRQIADDALFEAVLQQPAPPPATAQAYLYKTLADTRSSADYLYEQTKVHLAKANYPATAFGRDLKQVAELITADTNTQIYYLSLSGFDTHANQKGAQERLFKQYSQGVTALIQDLRHHGLFDDTLILTFSEFGRRVKQNGSGGTDHGKANNLFLMGGRLHQRGLYNPVPSLAQLDDGDLQFEIDFRRVYADILNHWLAVDASAILRQPFTPLGLFQ